MKTKLVIIMAVAGLLVLGAGEVAAGVHIASPAGLQ